MPFGAGGVALNPALLPHVPQGGRGGRGREHLGRVLQGGRQGGREEQVSDAYRDGEKKGGREGGLTLVSAEAEVVAEKSEMLRWASPRQGRRELSFSSLPSLLPLLLLLLLLLLL